MLCSDQSKTSELIILRYKGAEFGKAKHNVEGQQQADQAKCHNCLQIWICNHDKNPLPRFFSGMDIFAFAVCHFLKLSDPRLRASFSNGQLGITWTRPQRLCRASQQRGSIVSATNSVPMRGTADTPLTSSIGRK